VCGHTSHCSPGEDQMIPWRCYANIWHYRSHTRMHGKVKYFYFSYSRTFIVINLTMISVHCVCKSMRLIVFSIHSTVLIQSVCMSITYGRFKSFKMWRSTWRVKQRQPWRLRDYDLTVEKLKDWLALPSLPMPPVSKYETSQISPWLSRQ
jgi:hypothetical protein